MDLTIIIWAGVALCFVAYFAIGMVQTPSHVSRLVCRFGNPVRVLNPGLGIYFPIFEVYYDYSRRIIQVDFKEEKVFTPRGYYHKRGESEAIEGELTDDMNLVLDSVVYLSLPREHRDVDDLWEKGLSPRPFQELNSESTEALKKFVEAFTLAAQRNQAGCVTWKDILYKKEVFSKEVQTALTSSDEEGETVNPFKALGITDIRYVIKNIQLPSDMETALHKMAVEKNNAEAADYEAEVIRKKLQPKQDLRAAATIDAISDKDKIIFGSDIVGAIGNALGGGK